MHAGHSYRCPQCGEEFAADVTCFRCDIFPVDENGNCPPPTFSREDLSARGSASGTDGDFFFALAAVGELSVRALAREVRGLNRRRHARRKLHVPLLAIGDVHDTPAHIRGVVEVIEPVHHPELGEVALYLRRRKETKPSAAFETNCACGKLIIRDETGAALLDDDFFVLLPRPGHHPMARSDVDIVVRQGDTLEVAGPAARQPRPELMQAEQSGYRSSSTMVVFDGSSADLLTIRPAEQSGP